MSKFAKALLLCLLAFTTFRAAAGDVGKVLMASGEATLSRAGRVVPLREGDVIEAGDILATGTVGHVYLRFPDGSLAILRPASILDIEKYTFDAANPARTEIRFGLRAGVLRSITGQNLGQHKDRYRLNTPLAAIGVRGTDFTTYVGADLVRVSVHLGGIAMAPYGPDCAAAALGACEGPHTGELYANTALMLELRSGQTTPRLLPADQGAPNRIAPPLDREPARAAAARGESQPANLQETLAIERIEALSARPHPAPEALPVVVPPIPNIALAWGRWADIAGLPAATFAIRDLPADKQQIALNALYAIVRDKGFELPAAGQYAFALQQGEAWRLSDGAARALVIGAATLNIDFNRSSFATRLDLSDGDKRWAVRGQGDITRDGRLVSSYLAGSNASIRGALGGQGASQAAYIFQQTAGKDQLFGATHWTRH